jgi:hypothetical protein
MAKFPSLVREQCQQLAIDSLGKLEADIGQLSETAIWQLPKNTRQKLREVQEHGPRINMRRLFQPLGSDFIPSTADLKMMSSAIADLECQRLVICTRDGRGRVCHARLSGFGKKRVSAA